MSRQVRVLLTVGLLGTGLLGPAQAGLAHKGKLPEDALTLVQQASALLAQNPGMTAEVRERLQAALKSRKPEGVNLDQVAEALRALERRDIATARRLLAASIMPATMPMPPQAPRRPPGQPPAPPEAPPPPAAPLPAAQAPPSVEEAMKMAEPLRVRFTGSRAEIGILAAGLLLIALALVSFWRDREVGT